jgi:hypothetical protein
MTYICGMRPIIYLSLLVLAAALFLACILIALTTNHRMFWSLIAGDWDSPEFYSYFLRLLTATLLIFLLILIFKASNLLEYICG